MNGQNGFDFQNSQNGYVPAGGLNSENLKRSDKRRFTPGHPLFDFELYKERQAVRRVGNTVGLPMSVFILGSQVLSTLLYAVMMGIVGFEKTVELTSKTEFLYILNAVITLVLLTVPFVFAVKMIDAKPRELLPFKRVTLSKSVPLFMLGMGACALSNYASSSFSAFYEELFGSPTQGAMDEFGSSWQSLVIMVLCVGILPALLEEFAVRGIVLGALRTKFSDTAAIFISAAMFGLLHGNLVQIPFAFGVGLALGYATVYSGSLFPAIFIHAANNTLAVVMDYATQGASPLTSQVVSLLYYAVMLLLGICGFILLVKTDRDAFKLSAEKSENTKKYFKWFCGSGWIVTFIIACAVLVALSQGLISLS